MTYAKPSEVKITARKTFWLKRAKQSRTLESCHGNRLTSAFVTLYSHWSPKDRLRHLATNLLTALDMTRHDERLFSNWVYWVELCTGRAARRPGPAWPDTARPGPARPDRAGPALKFLTKIGPGRVVTGLGRAGPGGSGPAVEKVL